MTAHGSTTRTRLTLSFNSAGVGMARQLAGELERANIAVRYDQWSGGGGAPAIRSTTNDIAETAGVLVLLGRADITATWIGDEWKHAVYDRACALGLPILPVRVEPCSIPAFLEKLSFADLCHRDRRAELRRLVQAIRELSGDVRIELPDDAAADIGRVAQAPPAEPITLEIGSALSGIFDEAGLDRFQTESVPMMRDGLFYELGVPFPDLAVRVASDLPSSSARVSIFGVPETVVELHPGWVLVNDSAEAMAQRGFAAKPALNPANNNPCAWIPGAGRAAAEAGGLTIWDEADFLILTISALLRNKAANFIELDQTRLMLRKLELAFPQLVNVAVPGLVSEFLLSDVLRRLVAENVSIRNLRRIVMALATWARVESDPLYLSEYARAALQREITHRLTRGTGELVVFLLDPVIEDTLGAAMRHTPTGSYLDLPAPKLGAILDAIRVAVRALGEGVQLPAILTRMEIRSAVQRLVAIDLPLLNVTSYQELRPDTNIQPLGRITLDGEAFPRNFTVQSPWAADNQPPSGQAPTPRQTSPVVSAALEEIGQMLIPGPDGRCVISPLQLQQIDAILNSFVGSPDLAGLIQGLVNLAESLAGGPESEEVARAILGLLERPQILEPLEKLVQAAKHFVQHQTDISPELDRQLRDQFFRRHLNAGNTPPTVLRASVEGEG